MDETYIDARGLSCPQPVIKARDAISSEGARAVRIVVDDPAQVENVAAMARNQGWEARIDRQDGDDLEVLLTKAGTAGETSTAEGETCGTPTKVVVLLGSDVLGQGDDELGAILMRSFIKTLWEVVPRPHTLILMNGGVRLAVAGGELEADIARLSDAGVEVLACGTCLDFFDLKDRLAVGRVSNMYEIATALCGADRLVNP